jgi:hypothetical protein
MVVPIEMNKIIDLKFLLREPNVSLDNESLFESLIMNKKSKSRVLSK